MCASGPSSTARAASSPRAGCFDALRGLPLRGEVRRRDGDAVRRHQRELARERLVDDVGDAVQVDQLESRRLLGTELPAHRPHLERRQLGREAAGDVVERDAGGELGERAVGEPEPEPERAAAAPHLERVVDPRLPDREVHVVEGGVDPAVPALELGHGPPDEVAANLDRCAQLARRLRPQREAVMPAVVLEQEIDALEAERHRAPALVLPLDGRGADDDLALLEEPVAGHAVGALLGLQLEPGDEEPALRIATHDQARPVEDDGPETQLAGEERAPGKGDADVLEAERFLAAPVEDLHAGEFEAGVEAEPFRGDRADLDPLAERARDRGLDLRLVVGDRGQDPEAQAQHRDRDDEVQRDERPAGAAEPLEPAALDRRKLGLDQLVVGVVVEKAHLERERPDYNVPRIGPRFRSKPDRKYATPSDTNARAREPTDRLYFTPRIRRALT